MAVTSIWPRKAPVSKLVNYVCNPEKTIASFPTLESTLAFEDQEKARGTLENLLGYAMNPGKTEEYKFTYGLNCTPENAIDFFERDKKSWGKEGGILLYHGYQSFKPGEVTAEQCHMIGIELAEKLWADRFRVVVATHLDHDHLHNHFVISSVSWADGKKFRCDHAMIDKLRVMSDELCREHGLSVIERPGKGRGVNPKIYDELGINRPPAFFTTIQKDIDAAIKCSLTMEDFYKQLQSKGYTWRKGNVKYFALKPPGKSRFTRIEKWCGDGYSLVGIAKRIRSGEEFENEATKQGLSWYYAAPKKIGNTNIVSGSKVKYKGNFGNRKKHYTGFQAQYIHYCYVFGVYKKRKKYIPIDRNAKRTVMLYSDLTRLTCKYNLKTETDVIAHLDNRRQETIPLYVRRKELYNRLRYTTSPEEAERIQAEITAINGELKPLRKEIRLCKRLLDPAPVPPADTDLNYRYTMDEIMEMERENEEQKEESQNGYGISSSKHNDERRNEAYAWRSRDGHEIDR